jgi:hypothetical protein
LGAILMAFSQPISAYAQTVTVSLREEISGVAIAGAIVRLLGDDGVVGQGLTNEQGRLTLRAPTAGSYRLKIDRIGASGLVTALLALAVGPPLRYDLAMPPRRTELPPLVRTGRSICRGGESGQGTLAAVLWEEIQKALTANRLTDEQASIPVHLRRFSREVDLKGRTQREWITASTLVRGQPFAVLSPSVLADSGFVQARGDSALFAAPDAKALLSDQFVELHCFRAVSGANGTVGLAFEPIPGRAVVDVGGTLWVNRSSAELQSLDFEYRGLPGDLARAKLGGRVEFQRLITGSWIVSYWHVRAPDQVVRLGRVSTGRWHPLPRLAGYRDRGGRAELAVDTLGRVNRALLMGEVHDSMASAGLADVIVQVSGVPDSVLTDAAGRFVLAVAASGDQMVTVRHPRLGHLGSPTSLSVLLSVGDTSKVDFVNWSLTTVVRQLCGPAARGHSGVVGVALGQRGEPVEGLKLWMKWRIMAGSGTREELRTTGPRGIFAFCDLPAGRTLWIRTRDQVRGAVWWTSVTIPAATFQWLELKLREPSLNPGAETPPLEPRTNGLNL